MKLSEQACKASRMEKVVGPSQDNSIDTEWETHNSEALRSLAAAYSMPLVVILLILAIYHHIASLTSLPHQITLIIASPEHTCPPHNIPKSHSIHPRSHTSPTISFQNHIVQHPLINILL